MRNRLKNTPIMKKLSAILLSFILCAYACAAEKRPNFLIIVADDMGYSDAGCYGGEIQTPVIDSLAKTGLRYTDFYNTARCWTTRSSVMCGYYHTQLNTENPNVKKHPAWIRSLAQMLKPLGYDCYLSGKWHVYPFKKISADAGFDRSYYLHDDNYLFAPKVHFLDDKPLPAVADGNGYGYTTKGVTDYMIDFLKEHKRDRPNEPFFAYLAYIVPHFPLMAPADAIAANSGKYAEGWDVFRAKRLARMKELGFPPKWSLPPTERSISAPSNREGLEEAISKLGDGEIGRAAAWDDLTQKQKDFQAKKMEIHAAMVESMDKDIGRVIDLLKAEGEFDNTVIMFFSDNGASAEIMVRGDGHDPSAPMGSAKSYLCLGPGWAGMSNTPFRRYKIWTHEGGISTPFIVHWGDKIKDGGAFRTAPAHVVDIVPTILSLAGSNAERASENAPKFPGKDISATFFSDKPVDRDFLYFSHSQNRALRMGDWKIVCADFRGEKLKWALYNLKDDRAETRDLSEKYPEKLKEMVSVWEKADAEFSADAKK